MTRIILDCMPAYYQSEPNSQLPRVKWQYITHMTYQSVEPTSETDATLMFPNGDEVLLNQLITESHNRGKKAGLVVAELGGYGHHRIKAITVNPILLSQFVTNIMYLVNKYNIDYILVDQEDIYHPQWNPDGQPISEIEIFLSELKSVLDNKQLVLYSAGVVWMSSTIPFVDYLWCITNDPAPEAMARWNGDLAYFDQLRANGWTNDKLLVLNKGYGFTWNPRTEVCEYNDIYSQIYPSNPNVFNLSQVNVSSITDRWGNPHSIPNGILYYDGLDIIKTKCDYIKGNGLAGMACYCGCMDAPDVEISTMKYIYENLTGENLMVTFSGNLKESVSGKVVSGKTVSITVNKPDSTTEVLTATSDSLGNYTVAKEYAPGSYTAKASVVTDATYNAVSTAVLPFMVNKLDLTLTLDIG